MGVGYNPRIVTDGLVLCLDAANAKSYPGSGATWTDLSGNGNNASMFSSVPFETDVVGCFNFAGTTGAGSWEASRGFTFTNNMVTRTGSFTFSCWVKNFSTTANVGLFSNAGADNGYRFGVGTTGVYFLVGMGAEYTEGVINFASSLSTSLWYNIVATYDRLSTKTVKVYNNGAFVGSANMPASQTISFPTTAPGIVRSPCCGVYTGKLAQFTAYNKILSEQEIQQNFYALKGRFRV